ncbi:hypothetical protein SAMN05216409_105130 [Pseudomonas lutea]|uniref:Uncharacterized protein n=1 Tax=Pseudomonas lutea TaxID=243924 RepID=A0A9X8QJ38_9PSED|nr:hypothetical protein SAMN05216409_105130 [Pseudomonas lutea]
MESIAAIHNAAKLAIPERPAKVEPCLYYSQDKSAHCNDILLPARLS